MDRVAGTHQPRGVEMATLEDVTERKEREEAVIRSMSDELIMSELVRIAHFNTSFLTTKERRILTDAARRMSSE